MIYSSTAKVYCIIGSLFVYKNGLQNLRNIHWLYYSRACAVLIRKMATISKPQTVNFSCYELGHTWTPSCKRASIDVAILVAKSAFKIYGTLFLVRCRKRCIASPNLLKLSANGWVGYIYLSIFSFCSTLSRVLCAVAQLTLNSGLYDVFQLQLQ